MFVESGFPELLIQHQPGQDFTLLAELLNVSVTTHSHICPRQVLGVRMGLLAGEILNLGLPQTDKRLLVIVETDGCFVDGITAATDCRVGQRTLMVEDYGKVAAAFVDTLTEQAVRIAPRPEARTLATDFAPEANNRWEAMLLGYQRMPAPSLFSVCTVCLKTPIAQIISRPGKRTVCDMCREEIINERESVDKGATLCRACAGQAYYSYSMK